jgi:hypothetical protein
MTFVLFFLEEPVVHVQNRIHQVMVNEMVQVVAVPAVVVVV